MVRRDEPCRLALLSHAGPDKHVLFIYYNGVMLPNSQVNMATSRRDFEHIPDGETSRGPGPTHRAAACGRNIDRFDHTSRSVQRQNYYTYWMSSTRHG